ncbi:MAG: uroporphyrinogen decarboxylase family protein [Promethearchaeota archaeon]
MGNPMNVHERFMAALNHEEPDRVPTLAQYFEPGFTIKVIKKFKLKSLVQGLLTRHFHLFVAKIMGFDSIWFHYTKQQVPKNEKPEIPEDVRKSFGIKGEPGIWGHVSERSSAGMNWYQTGVLKTPELVREWTSFIRTWEPGTDAQYDHFKKVWDKWITKKSVIPIPTSAAVAWVTWSSIGLDRFAYLARKHLNLVRDLAKAWGEFTKKTHDCFFERGIDLVFICDDFALKGRTIYNPKLWAEIIHPVYKMLAKHAHSHGAKFLIHGDGFVGDVLDQIVKSGADAIEPLEYEAGNRLKPLKQEYGDDITLIGNVPATDVLTFGSIEDTIKMTKECLLDAAEGGGYVLGAGSDILATCKIENVLAMTNTVKKFGTYPIDKIQLATNA